MDQITKNVCLAKAGESVSDTFFISSVGSTDTDRDYNTNPAVQQNNWHQVLSNGDIIVSANYDVATSTTDRYFPAFIRFDKTGNVIAAKSWSVAETVTSGDGGPQGAFYYDEATDNIFYAHGNNTHIYVISQNWTTDTVNWAVDLDIDAQNQNYFANVQPCSNGTHILVTNTNNYQVVVNPLNAITVYPYAHQTRALLKSDGSRTSGATKRSGTSTTTGGAACAKPNCIQSNGTAWIQYSAADYDADNQTHYFLTVDTSATTPDFSDGVNGGHTPRFTLGQNAPNIKGATSCALSPDENYLYNVGGITNNVFQVTKVGIGTEPETLEWDKTYTLAAISPDSFSPNLYQKNIVVDKQGDVYVGLAGALFHGTLPFEYGYLIVKIDGTDGSVIYTKRLVANATSGGQTDAWHMGKFALTKNDNFIINGSIESIIGGSTASRTSAILCVLPNDTDNYTFDSFKYEVITNPTVAENNVTLTNGATVPDWPNSEIISVTRNITTQDLTLQTNYNTTRTLIE